MSGPSGKFPSIFKDTLWAIIDHIGKEEGEVK